MLFSRSHRRVALTLLAATSAFTLPGRAQTPATAPASIPANVTSPVLQPRTVSPRVAREADDAYIAGAKHVAQKDFAAAERSFTRALELNPGNRDYVLALAVTREHHLTELVQNAAKARLLGNDARADALLAEAKSLDPDNRIVTQHFDPGPLPSGLDGLSGNHLADTLDGPIHLTPSPGTQSFHRRGDPQDILRTVYTAFGITPTFDPSVTGGPAVKFDLDDVDFEAATRIAGDMTHTAAAALQPKSALIFKDTPENRNLFVPQIEETLFFPGYAPEAITELANVARTVFDLRQVTASSGSSKMLLRGDEPTLKLVNATFADMLDGGSDVLLDINIYEIDKSHTVNIGAQTPSSVGVISVASTLQNLLNANQSLISQAIAAGALKLTGNSAIDIPNELAVLVAGGVSLGQFSNFLGTFGNFAGLPLAGVFLGSSATFNLLLNSSEVRTLDSIQVRGSNRQPLNFRAGSRYPIVTATYGTGVSSAAASQLAGIKVNGTSVAGLLAQYLGSSQASVPQFQFEDLGLTLKATPQILHSSQVALALELKIEALGGGAINDIPILNSRALTSTVTVPAGQTALLVSQMSSSEARALGGLPLLSELPGFQGTDKSTQKDSAELLITITPHIVRAGNLRIASRALSTPHTTSAPQ